MGLKNNTVVWNFVPAIAAIAIIAALIFALHAQYTTQPSGFAVLGGQQNLPQGYKETSTQTVSNSAAEPAQGNGTAELAQKPKAESGAGKEGQIGKQKNVRYGGGSGTATGNDSKSNANGTPTAGTQAALPPQNPAPIAQTRPQATDAHVSQNQTPSIKSFSPEGNVELQKGGSQVFHAEISGGGEDAILSQWFVDEKPGGDGGSFTFDSTAYTDGNHVVKVLAANGKISVSKEWKLLITQPPKPSDPAGKIHPLLRFEQKGNVRIQSAQAKTVRALITVDEPAKINEIVQLIRDNGGEPDKTFETGGVITATISQSKLRAIANNNDVVSLWPNLKVFATLDTSVQQTGAPQVWSEGYMGANVRVAVIDTGTDSTHPMLKGRVTKEKNFTGSKTTNDIYGHGTHVAGIIAGSKEQGGLHDGMAPGALLYNVKVLDDNGSGYYEDIIAGINWALDPDSNPATDDGARIINMSLGSPETYSETNPIMTAIKAATGKGVIVVVSAGNCGPVEPSQNCEGYIGVTSPGSSPYALTVGAVDDKNIWAGFSSGQNIEGVGIKPDVSAPGVLIESSYPTGRYRRLSGTSMAAPHVAGAAALLLSAEPSLKPMQAKKLLELTSVDLGEPGKDTKFGAGMLNLRDIIEPRPVLSKENVSGSIDESETFTGSITITNEGAKNLEIYGVQPTHGIEISFAKTSLGAAESAELGFSIKGTETGVGPFEGTIDLNTNAGARSVHVKLQVGTSTKPVIRSLSIPKTVWRGEVSDIVVLATDDSTVTSVVVRITGPVGTSTEIPLVLSADGKWRYIDYAFPKETSDKGNYKVEVIAADDSANTTVYETAFDLVNARFVLPEEYVVNSAAAIKASYKNTSFQSKDTTFVVGIYNETKDKVGELLGTNDVQSGQLHEFGLEWTPSSTGNYTVNLKLFENGSLVEELEKGITVLVPDIAIVRGFSIGSPRLEKGTVQTFDVNAENFSANDLNAIIEVDVLHNNIVADVIVLENAIIPSNLVQHFGFRKNILLPAGTYNAIAKLHFGNRVKDSNLLTFEVFTPGAGTLDSAEMPERIYTDTVGKVKAVFRNNANVPMNVALYGKILDGNTIVSALDFNSVQVQQNSAHEFESDANFSGLSGNYSLKITAEYEGNIAQADKNFFVTDDKAPIISDAVYDPAVKSNGAFTLRFIAHDSSMIAKATLSVNGDKTEIKEVSSNGNEHFFTGAYYGTSSPQEYGFFAQVCDQYSNCTATQPKTFNVTECNGKKVLVVLEEDTFTGLLGENYCLAQWKENISGLAPLDLLRSFDAVIWSEGLNLNGIDDNEAELLQTYVAFGGRLLLEGAGIASAHAADDAFMPKVAHATLAQNLVFTAQDSNTPSSGLHGSNRILANIRHPVTKGQSYFDINMEISPYSDSLFPTNGGHSIADWNSGNSAMVVFDDYNTTGARGIFLPLAFGSIETSKQKTLLENTLFWLAGTPTLDFNATKITTPDYIISGENVPVTIEHENSGSAQVAVYVDGGLAEQKTAGIQSTRFNITFTQGNHNIRAEIKPDEDTQEIDYFNNAIEKNVFAAPLHADIAPLKVDYAPQKPSIGEPVRIYAYIGNNGGQTSDANVGFFIDGNLFSSQIISIPYGRQATAGIEWIASAGTHTISVIAKTPEDDANTLNDSLESAIYTCNGPGVLIVADDDARSFNSSSPDSTKAFEGALREGGYCTSTWKESEKGVPTPDLLNNFSAVVWSSGNHWNRVMDENDSNTLSQFNGNILFEGSDIGFDSNNSEFLEKNMHASFDRDIILDKNNSGLVLFDSNLLEGITSIELDANLSPTPDSLIPFESQSIADWNNAGSAIIASEDGAQRRGFIGFSINAITTPQTRDKLVLNFMKWLTFKNHAPAILSVATNSPLKEGEKLSIDVNAIDPEGDALSYSINSEKFSAYGNSFSWPTDFNSAGNYTFTITVSDGNLSATQDINLEVINVNRAPIILSATANSPVKEDENLTIDINATDPDNDALSYTINSPRFITNVNTLTWPTDYNSSGIYTFTITASDGNLTATQDINAEVINVNRPPEILSVTANNPSMEGGQFIIDINATDPDAENLAYSINSLLFDGNAGHFTWNIDYNSAGDYNFTVTVSDGNLEASADVNATILNVNRAPIIHGISYNPEPSEGQTITLDINATDPDNDAITYSANIEGLDINNNILTLFADYNSAGNYTFTATVSDGDLNTSSDINITILNTNRAPIIQNINTNPPVKEGESLTIDVNAFDPDDDNLTYAINSNAFEVDGNRFTWLTDYNSAGEYNFTVMVSDANLSASSDINATVNNTNRQPIIFSANTNSPVHEGEILTIDINAIDPDGDTLAFGINSPKFDVNEGTFTWATDYNSAGDYNLTIIVSDGNQSSTAHINITVGNTNRPPAILETTSNSPVREGEKLTIDVNAQDPDADAITYSVNHPMFEINGNTLAWLTDFNSAGDYNLTITATDGTLAASTDLNITVLNANRPPRIISITANSPVTEGGMLTIDVNATDPDNDKLTYTINSQNFVANGNLFSWQTSRGSTGMHTFTITISDASLSASQDVNVEIRKLERPPGITPIGKQQAYTGSEFALQVVASDPDNDAIRYSDNTTLFDIDAATGRIKFTPTKEQAGTYNITITASDGTMDSNTDFNLTISRINKAPTIEIPYYRNVYTIGEEVTIPVNGSDPDGDPITYSINSNLFKFANNAFVWKTDENSEGTHTFTITASDGLASAYSHALISVLKIVPGGVCSDTDGGLNYYEKSTADDRVNGIGSWWEDVCLLRVVCKEGDPGYGSFGTCHVYTRVDECSGSLCNLQEGFCSNGQSSNIAVTCEYGCRAGTCIRGENAAMGAEGKTLTTPDTQKINPSPSPLASASPTSPPIIIPQPSSPTLAQDTNLTAAPLPTPTQSPKPSTNTSYSQAPENQLFG